MTHTELAPASSYPLASSSHLATAAINYAKASRSRATRRAYQTQWSRFEAWCASHGAAALPASPAAVALFVTHLADEKGFKPSTISQALSSIAHHHVLANLDSPTAHPQVKEVVRGIRREKGTAQKKARALSPQELRELSRACGNNLRGIRDRALLVMGFAGALRRSELVGLNVSDIKPVPEGVELTLRRSKTDQEGEGAKLGLPYGSDMQTCPVRTAQLWVEAANINSGPLFVGVRRSGKLSGYRLHGRDVNRVIERAAKRAELTQLGLSSHSLRAGLVTTAAKKGRPLHAIQKQSRHKSLQVLSGYIRDAALFEDNAAAGIGL